MLIAATGLSNMARPRGLRTPDCRYIRYAASQITSGTACALTAPPPLTVVPRATRFELRSGDDWSAMSTAESDSLDCATSTRMVRTAFPIRRALKSVSGPVDEGTGAARSHSSSWAVRRR